jgi:hypothetical protein
MLIPFLGSKKGVKFYTEAIVSLTHICCRYYGQSEPREGGNGYSLIRNMMMMMMRRRRRKKKILEILVL